MSTTNLGIDQIFPNYSLTTTAATKASLADAINVNGSADNDAFTVTALGVSVTITLVGTLGSPAANNIQITRATSDATNRDRVRLAINGSEDANIAYGSGTSSSEGVDGVNASNGTANTQVSLEAEETGANTISVSGSLTSGASSTGTTASGSAVIPLSDLSFSGNEMTVAEGGASTGDYRKFLFHMIRRYEGYYADQESVASITISTAGAGYTVGDTLVFTGGAPDVTAAGTVSAVDGSGAITGVTISNAGKGYSTAPTITITAQGTVGTTAALTAVLTDNLPAKLTLSRGSLSENTSTGILSRSYTTTFGFNESGLELATD